MELDNSKAPSNAIHWRSAMLTVFRLRDSEGLIDDANLAALKIRLDPPCVSTPLSPELNNQLDSYLLDEAEVNEVWQNKHKWASKRGRQPLGVACAYGSLVGHQYRRISKREQWEQPGYWFLQRYQMKSPKLAWQRRRHYYIFIKTQFLIQYGFTLPYRTCGIAQTRHSGERALSATEVLSLLILAIESYKSTPNHPSYTARVFVFDMFYVRRLTAVVPATYIRILLKSAKRVGTDELVGNITVEQTPYFDIRDPAGLRGAFVALLEDEDKVEPWPYDNSDAGDI